MCIYYIASLNPICVVCMIFYFTAVSSILNLRTFSIRLFMTSCRAGSFSWDEGSLLFSWTQMLDNWSVILRMASFNCFSDSSFEKKRSDNP